MILFLLWLVLTFALGIGVGIVLGAAAQRGSF